MSYRYETYMRDRVITRQFVNKIFINSELLNTTYFGFEVENLFGIPDIVFTQFESNSQIRICAIELKLSNWNRALVQAFRYRSFADYSYVVLDNSKISPALKHISEFKNKNIGLFGLDEEGTIYEYFLPILKPPYSPEMVKKITDMANNGEGFQKLSAYIS